MDFTNELTLEQQFRLQTFKQQVEELSREEAQAYLLEVLRQMMVKDNMFKNMLKNG